MVRRHFIGVARVPGAQVSVGHRLLHQLGISAPRVGGRSCRDARQTPARVAEGLLPSPQGGWRPTQKTRHRPAYESPRPHGC